MKNFAEIIDTLLMVSNTSKKVAFCESCMAGAGDNIWKSVDTNQDRDNINHSLSPILKDTFHHI